jgi:NADH:ubiquinone oxidoreductase subunit 2 (subunit N)
MLIVDFGSSCTKLFCIAVSIFCLIMCQDSLDRSCLACYEFFILFLLSIFGILFFISSVDLFTMFLSLEIQSICLYALVSLNNGSGYGSEAGIKFFILGAFSSGVIIFGISLLYGAVGSTNLFSIYNILLFLPKPQLSLLCLTKFSSFFFIDFRLVFGILLLFIGFFLKLQWFLFICGHLIFMKVRLYLLLFS